MLAYPLHMMNTSCWCMNATLLAQLTFIIIFFLYLFCKFSPFVPLIELFKFIFFDQLFDPCFKLVFCYRHKITRFQVASAAIRQHQHEGKYVNKKTHTTNNSSSVVCVVRSRHYYTTSLYIYQSFLDLPSCAFLRPILRLFYLSSMCVAVMSAMCNAAASLH